MIPTERGLKVLVIGHFLSEDDKSGMETPWPCHSWQWGPAHHLLAVLHGCSRAGLRDREKGEILPMGF